jgi:putative heme-binding domain-containing protein
MKEAVYSLAQPLAQAQLGCLKIVGFLIVAIGLFPLTRAAEPDKAAIAVEALSRLKGIDLEANPAVKTAVMRVVETTKGTPQFVELVRDFKIKDQENALLDFAMTHPGDSAAAEAMRLILAGQNVSLLDRALQGPQSAKVVEPLGNTGEKQIVPLLVPLITAKARDLEARQRAVHALAQIQEGAAALLELAKQQKLPDDLKLIASSELNSVRWPNLKAEAAQLLPLPQSQNSEPLPPVSELTKRKGDPAHGEQVFFSAQVGCGNCHQAGSKGVDFGPKLSEIGTKLGKDALYVSILDPNAGVSFGYETWQVELKSGDEAYGLLASETEEEIAIKAPGGIVRTQTGRSGIQLVKEVRQRQVPKTLKGIYGFVSLVDHAPSWLSSSHLVACPVPG